MSISNPTEGPQLLAKAIRDAHTVDTIGGLVTFTVKVISPPIFRSAAEVAALTGEPAASSDQEDTTEVDPEKIQQFQGRIESEYFMSPHLPIPDPCNLSVADSNNAQLAFAYAALHTTCFTPLGWSDGRLKVGDRCRVTMRKGDFKMDLQYATVDSLQSSYLTVQSEASKNECSTLASLFEDFSGTLGDSAGGTAGGTAIIKLSNSLPDITAEDGVISGSSLDKLTSVVKKELSLWSGKKEKNEEMRLTLEKYWDNLGASPDPVHGPPWSAVFISWVVNQVDPGFPKAVSHYGYTKAAQEKKGNWSAWKIGSAKIQAQVGDILVRPRTGEGTVSTSSHGDVVYKIEGGKAFLAGGNLSQSARGNMQLPINSEGNYANYEKYIVVLKKNGTVKPQT